jgi:hypothetical protein
VEIPRELNEQGKIMGGRKTASAAASLHKAFGELCAEGKQRSFRVPLCVLQAHAIFRHLASSSGCVSKPTLRVSMSVLLIH